jgi:hypothetical protein
MIRFVLRLAFVALIANAAWHLGTAYLAYYKFKDSVTETVRFSKEKSDERLHRRVLELASQFDIPLAADAFTIRHENGHTYVDGAYVQPVELVPGYSYPWSFSWSIDAFTITPTTPDQLRSPR